MSNPRKVGRPRLESPLQRISVRLNSQQLEWLSLWSESPSVSIHDLFDRAMKFWPSGPNAFGHVRKSGGAK